MRYYSTSYTAPEASLSEAVVQGLAPDNGLYMPRTIRRLPSAFFKNMGGMSLQDIGYVVANTLFGEDIDSETLRNIVNDTLTFDIPLRHVEGDKYMLELFHGPTLAFKDVGARFMARLLGHFTRSKGIDTVNVLVATSGDTGSAVANGFLGVEGVHVYVLYPSGRVSRIQEMQFTTLGNNITALEVKGSFDDCQAMVKGAFLDPELRRHMNLTSANSINVARFLPQMFYYFYAVAQLMAKGEDIDSLVFAVPSGNLGNLCAGLIAKHMGLPIQRFIAANNRNDVFAQYLATGEYAARTSVNTIANAMDVGNPSNFARILDLYGSDHDAISVDITGASYNDEQIAQTIADVYMRDGYLLDPHGATAFRALTEQLAPGETGIALATAHPAKFKTTVESIIGQSIELPDRLEAFMQGHKESVKLSPTLASLKRYLMNK